MMLVLGFEDYRTQGEALAQALGSDYREIDTHHFPDGESKLTLPTELPKRVIICRSLDHPNAKLIELFLAVDVARQQAVQHISLVAPYLCYMRQDIAFHPGEAISQKIIGRWLGELFDRVITVDPHLHRIKHLSEAIPGAEALSLTATTAMAEFLNTRMERPVLLGPDEESGQWVKQIADLTGLDWAVARKQRFDDRHVEISLPDFDFQQRNIMLVDDVVSTGKTLMMAAHALQDRGVKHIDCMVTHPLFADQAERNMRDAGIRHIISTDSISHPSNHISLASTLAAALGKD